MTAYCPTIPLTTFGNGKDAMRKQMYPPFSRICSLDVMTPSPN